jgi:hypothetical protein
LSPVIADGAKLKGSNKSTVAVKTALKDDEGAWIINRSTVQASFYLDVFNGYAAYLMDAVYKVDLNGRAYCESPPGVGDCLAKCHEHKLTLSPVPASLNTQRKAENSKAPFAYLRRFDISQNVLWPSQKQSEGLFVVANTKMDLMFPTSAFHVSQSIPTLKGLGHHTVDVVALSLTKMALAGVRYLRYCFDLMFGPCGMGHKIEKTHMYSLEGDPAATFARSYCTGDFGTPMESWLPSQYLEAMEGCVRKHIEKSTTYSDLFGSGGTVYCYSTLLLKISDPRFKGRIQLPHCIMSPDKVKAGQSALLVRAIVPVDRAGCVIVVWPNGVGQPSKLVFVPSGTALILPVTVLTSDCPSFTPSGQAHAEFVFAFFQDERYNPEKYAGDHIRLPDGLVFESNDHHYPNTKAFKLTEATDRSIVIPDGSLKHQQNRGLYPGVALYEFLNLFSPMY